MAGYYSATQQHQRRRSTGRLSHRRLHYEVRMQDRVEFVGAEALFFLNALEIDRRGVVRQLVVCGMLLGNQWTSSAKDRTRFSIEAAKRSATLSNLAKSASRASMVWRPGHYFIDEAWRRASIASMLRRNRGRLPGFCGEG